MAALPSLVVNLALNSVEFVSGLTKAQYEATKATKAISGQIESIGRSISGIAGALGVGFGVHEIISFAKEVTLATEELQHLADQTGSSVEELSRLSNIVKISGGSVEEFQQRIDRLAAGLSGSEELSTKTANALRFLGVQSKDPATAMQEIANRLNQFADGAGKAAIARDLFGRSGVAFLAQLKAIAEETDVTATKTAEQARQAEELARTFRRLAVESHGLADAFLNDIAPALEKIAQLLVAATRETGSFFKGLGQAATIDPFGNVSKQITEVQEKLAKAKADAGKDTGALFQFQIGPSDAEIIKQFEQRLAILRSIQTAQAKVNDASNFDHFDRALSQKPLLPYVSGTGAGAIDDPSKRILEGQIKALDAAIAQEKAILSSREEFLKETFAQGFLSVENYYAQLQTARQQDINATNAYYDREIKLAEDAIGRTTKSTDRQEAINRAQDLRDKQIKFNQETVDSEQRIAFNRVRDTAEYASQLEELRAKMLDLKGATAEAAAIRFAGQNALLVNRLQSSGNAAGLADYRQLAAADDLQARLNQTTKVYQGILGAVSIEQGYLNLAQQSGAISEIDFLNKSSELNKSRLVQFQAQLDKLREIAANPLATAEQINQVKAMELEVARLAASTDLLADKFNKTFGDAFSSAFSDFISGTKTAKEAFNDFVKSVTKSISDIASQNIASALFGKGGGLSGIGDIFSKIFGGKLGGGGADVAKTATDATGATALTTAAGLQSTAATATSTAAALSTAASEAMTVAAGLLNAAGVQLSAAAVTLAASSAASSASSIGGLAGLFGKIGASSTGGGYGGFDAVSGYAGGTDFARGGLTLVGERGPEFVNLPRGSQVFPSGTQPSGQRPNLSIVVNVPQGTSGPSADQIGIRVGAHVQRAISRNG